MSTGGHCMTRALVSLTSLHLPQPKQPPGVGRGLGGQLFERAVAEFGQAAGGMNQVGRFVVFLFASQRMGNEIGRIGFD